MSHRGPHDRFSGESPNGNGEIAYAFDPQGSVENRYNASDQSLTADHMPATDVLVWDGYGLCLNDQWGKTASEAYDYQYNPAYDPAGFEAQAGYAGEWDNYLARNWTGTKSFQNYRYEPYLLTQRYYDPSTGKFASRDPIGTAGGENLYGYAGDDPVNEVDPSGTSNDPMPTKDPHWVRISVSLFIPMPEFVALHTHYGYVTMAGDDRDYSSNSNADRVRVDFAINTATGKLKIFAEHTAGSTMTTWYGKVERATAAMVQSVKVTGGSATSGWNISASGEGWDPFYDFHGDHFAPPARFSATFHVAGSHVTGVAHYGDFPATEIWEYDSALSGGHTQLFGFWPGRGERHLVGPLALYTGTHNHEAF